MSDLTLTEALSQDLAFADDEVLEVVASAARLVASGEVVAKTDLREIRWCLAHDGYGWEGPGAFGREQCVKASPGLGDDPPCRIVAAGLYLEGDTE